MTPNERLHAADAADTLDRFRKALDRTALRKPAPMGLVIALFALGLGGLCCIAGWVIWTGKPAASDPYIVFAAPFGMLMIPTRSRIVNQLRPELDEIHAIRFAAPFSEIEAEMKSLMAVYPASPIASVFVTTFLFILLTGGIAVSAAFGCLPELLLVYFLGSLNLIAVHLFEKSRLRRLHDWIIGLRCKCGYDLAGNSAGRCPECGAGIPLSVASELADDTKSSPPPRR